MRPKHFPPGHDRAGLCWCSLCESLILFISLIMRRQIIYDCFRIISIQHVLNHLGHKKMPRKNKLHQHRTDNYET